MKMSHFLLPSAALLLTPFLTASVVTDVPPDPSMVILRGGDATNINGPEFSFGAGPNGGGIFVFDNNTGQSISELNITVTVPDPNPIAPPAYTFVNFVLPGTSNSETFGKDCSGVAGNFDCVHVTLFDPSGAQPIAPGATFTFDLNNSPSNDPGVNPPNYTGQDQPNGNGGWGPDTTFNSTVAFATPEPATLPLAAAGLTLLLWHARRRLAFHRD